MLKQLQQYYTNVRPDIRTFYAQKYIQHALQAEWLRLTTQWKPTIIAYDIIDGCTRACNGCYFALKEHGELIRKEKSDKIITESRKHHIPFIGLLGGEPLQKSTIPYIKEILRANPSTAFFAYTNGDYIATRGLDELASERNLAYSVSIDGLHDAHNNIRGPKSFEHVISAFNELHRRKMLFGASITLRNKIMDEIVSPEFLGLLEKNGVLFAHFMKLKSHDHTNVPVETFVEKVAQLRAVEKEYPIHFSYGSIANGIALSRKLHYHELFITKEGETRIEKTEMNNTCGNINDGLDRVIQNINQQIQRQS